MLENINELIDKSFLDMENIRDTFAASGDGAKADYYSVILNSPDIFKNLVRTQLMAGTSSFETIYKDLTKD